MGKRFWATYTLELRQLFRQWAYWLLQLFLFAFALRTLNVGSETYTAQELLWAGASRDIISLSSLAVLFLGAFSAGRARRVRMDTLEATLPAGAEVPLARWAALVTASLPFLVPALGIALFTGPLGSFLRGLPVFLLESILTFLFTASLVWLIETTWGIRRSTYVVLALLWIAAIFGDSLLNGPIPAPWAGQWDFTRFGNGGYTEAWGRLTQGDFPWLLNWFYVGMIALLIGLIVRAVDRKRFYRTTRLAQGVIGVAAALALGTYVLYGVLYGRVYAQTWTPWRGNPAQSGSDETFYNPYALPYLVTRYDVALDVESEPAFDVTMEVLNRGEAPLESLAFTLHAAVDLRAANADVVRDGGYVDVTLAEPLLPGEHVYITFEYVGNVYRYQYVWGGPPELESFISKDGILLPYSSGWYPRAGRIPAGSEKSVTGSLAEFRLSVTGTALPLVSNLPRTAHNTFESAGTSWATLIGAPLLETYELADDVYIVSTGDQYEQVAALLEQEFRAIRTDVARFIPSDVMIILTSPRWYFTIVPDVQRPAPMKERAAVNGFLPWSATADSWIYTYGVYVPVQHFFGDTTATLLTENVAQFISLQAHHENAEAMRAAHDARLETWKQGLPPQVNEFQVLAFTAPGFAYNYDITTTLIGIYEVYGVDGVSALLTAMRAEAEMLKSAVVQEVIAWIDGWIEDTLAPVGEATDF